MFIRDILSLKGSTIFNMMENLVPEFDRLGFKRERAGNALPAGSGTAA